MPNDNTTPTAEAYDAIGDAIAEIEQLDDWRVIHAEAESSPDDPDQVTLTLEHDPEPDASFAVRSSAEREHMQIVRDIIDDLDEVYLDGAPIDEVVAEAADSGMDPDVVRDEIEKMQDCGEVYEPRTDHLRVT